MKRQNFSVLLLLILKKAFIIKPPFPHKSRLSGLRFPGGLSILKKGQKPGFYPACVLILARMNMFTIVTLVKLKLYKIKFDLMLI